MRRREFIAGLGAAEWPVAARAQQSDTVRRVAMLLPAKADDSEYPILVETFVQGLQKANWIEGRNLKLDIRWGGGSVDGITKNATELVMLAPEVISRALKPSAGSSS